MEQKGATTTGYTKCVIDFLRTQRSIIVKGKVRTLGGGEPRTSVLDSCFSRMCNWLQVARHTIKAEFPEFAMVRAFEVFNLESSMGPTVRADHVMKLASIFGVDRTDLETQLLDMWPLARTHRQRGVSNHEAWRLAIANTRSTARSRESHPHDALVKVLASHLSWAVGTSAVERNFALVEQFMSDRAITEPLADDEIQLITLKGITNKERDKLCTEARDIWIACYPKPRQRIKARRDRNAQRPGRMDPSSERGFMRKRRLDTEVAAASVSSLQAAEPVERIVGVGGWEESHEKEVNFQRAKRKHRLMESLADGTLLEDEYDEDDLRNLAEIQKLESNTRGSYLSSKRRMVAVLHAPQLPSLMGKLYHTRDDLGGEVYKRIRCVGLRMTENLHHADVYIVRSVGNTPVEFLWPAVLQGKFIISMDFLLAKGAAGTEGSMLRYQPACQIMRSIFVTPRFARDHANRALDVLTAAAQPGHTPIGGTRWTLVTDVEKFNSLIAKANRQKKRSSVAAFVTEDDIRQNMFPSLHLQITAESFMEVLARIDRTHTFTGIGNLCGQ